MQRRTLNVNVHADLALLAYAYAPRRITPRFAACRLRVSVHVNRHAEQHRPTVDAPDMGGHDLRYDRDCVPRDPTARPSREAPPRAEAAQAARPAVSILQEPVIPQLRTSPSAAALVQMNIVTHRFSNDL